MVRQKYYSATLQRTLKGSFCYLLKHKTCLYNQDLNTVQPRTYWDLIYIIFLVFLVFVKAIDAAAAACRLSPEFESAIGLFLDVHFS